MIEYRIEKIPYRDEDWKISVEKGSIFVGLIEEVKEARQNYFRKEKHFLFLVPIIVESEKR